MGYAPVSVQPMPINMSMGLQQQQVVYPVQDCRPVPQTWSHVPPTNTAVPYIVTPVAFPQLNFETQQASSVASSAVSTPVVSCFSSPGYVSTYGYINTPILSSASCTPIASAMIYPELPPALDLDKSSMLGSEYPRRIS